MQLLFFIVGIISTFGIPSSLLLWLTLCIVINAVTIAFPLQLCSIAGLTLDTI